MFFRQGVLPSLPKGYHLDVVGGPVFPMIPRAMPAGA
jgi:hypothetical protein